MNIHVILRGMNSDVRNGRCLNTGQESKTRENALNNSFVENGPNEANSSSNVRVRACCDRGKYKKEGSCWRTAKLAVINDDDNIDDDDDDDEDDNDDDVDSGGGGGNDCVVVMVLPILKNPKASQTDTICLYSAVKTRTEHTFAQYCYGDIGKANIAASLILYSNRINDFKIMSTSGELKENCYFPS
jgi:hypothetical protein